MRRYIIIIIIIIIIFIIIIIIIIISCTCLHRVALFTSRRIFSQLCARPLKPRSVSFPTPK